MRPSIVLSAIATSRTIFGLRLSQTGSPPHPAESGSSPTGWSFISSCSPSHLAVTQLLLITESWLAPTRTLIMLFMRLHRRIWASFHSAQPAGLKTPQQDAGETRTASQTLNDSCIHEMKMKSSNKRINMHQIYETFEIVICRVKRIALFDCESG